MPDIFVFLQIIYLTQTSDGLSSPNPDFASILIQLVMFAVFARSIANYMEGIKEQNYNVMFLVIIASTATTIKLSNLSFSVAIIGLLIIYQQQTARTRILDIVRIVASAAIINLIWMYRGFILSGTPLYPSTIGYIPVDWAIPKDQITTMANVIFAVSRQRNAEWSVVRENWDWLLPWLRGLTTSRSLIHVLYPFAVSVVFSLGFLIIHLFKKEKRIRAIEFCLSIPLFIWLPYWFFTAPSPRFANGLFLLILITSILLFLLPIQKMVSRKKFIIIVCSVLLIGNFNYAAHFIYNYNFKKVKSKPNCGWRPIKIVPLEKEETSSGLIVYTPVNGDQTWDAPLPATPYFNENLRLRNPNQMSSGFTVIRE